MHGVIWVTGATSATLSYYDDNYNNRRSNSSAGDVNTGILPAALHHCLGGVAYQTPWEPLSLKIELEGNDYKHEPQENNQVQDSPINFGAVFKLNDLVDLTLGWERGNTALFGITLHTNFVSRKAPVKSYDPPAQPLPAQAPVAPLKDVDWAAVSQQLEKNAGYKVERIAQDSELMVYGEQSKYFYAAKGAGRPAGF